MTNANGIERHPSPSGAAYSDPLVVRGPGRWVEVSGQIGFDDDGKVPGDFAEEVRLCFEHVRRSLERAGASFADVVRLRTYMTDLEQYGVFSQARAQTFGETPPSSTAVGVSDLLFGAAIEIEALAFVSEG